MARPRQRSARRCAAASRAPPIRRGPRLRRNYLRDRITELGRNFDGRVGIAVRSIDDGWATGLESRRALSAAKRQQIVGLDHRDGRGRQGPGPLDDKVTLDRDDLTLFHQPIAALIFGGSYTTTLDDLMVKAITTSDNTANDKLMRSVGGPDAVRAMIAAKQLGAIRFYNGERALQSRIAGLIWSPSYSIGNAFYEARDALPLAVRKAAFNRYVNDPVRRRGAERDRQRARAPQARRTAVAGFDRNGCSIS